MPAWRAEYFDNAKDKVPLRIEIIESEYEADALVEARTRMPSNCSRAVVTRFDPGTDHGAAETNWLVLH